MSSNTPPMTPMTAAQLVPLLEIIKDPEHPAFNQALERLTTLDPTTLTPEDAPLLLTQIATALDNLTRASNLTAEQLVKLRTSNKALQSYGNR